MQNKYLLVRVCHIPGNFEWLNFQKQLVQTNFKNAEKHFQK